MAEVQRLQSISETDGPPGITDLAKTFDIDEEISPIT